MLMLTITFKRYKYAEKCISSFTIFERKDIRILSIISRKEDFVNFELRQSIVTFITNFADHHAIPLPGRLPSV